MTATPIKKPSAQKPLSLIPSIFKLKKPLILELELLNLSARQLSLEINHGHRNKSEKGNQKSMNR